MGDNAAAGGMGGAALKNSSISFGTLMASLGAGAAAFGIQFLLFNVLRLRLRRIYSPKTYLVPEKERVPDPPPGIIGWAISIFKTSNMDFIEKCGLDAYFFLRYLRMLLKIFLPLAIVLLPILLPVNSVGLSDNKMPGVNKFSWSNIPQGNQNRFWVHLVAAVCMDVYICYVMFGELRGYIRIRQAYLTSPQHRLRASATTVLVTNISRKWLTREALDGLYDVFPGGVRNIWINRNFDELDSLVQTRDSIANSLEDNYANLIKKAQKAFGEQQKKSRDGEMEPEVPDRPGVSTGNPHQIAQNLDEALGREMSGSSESLARGREDKRHIPIFSDVAQGFGAVGQGIGQGFGAVGQGVEKFGHFVRGGVTDTFNRGKRAETAEHPAVSQQKDGSEDPFANDAGQPGTSDTNPDMRFSGASDDLATVSTAQEPEPSNGSQVPQRGFSLRFKSSQQKSLYPSPQPKVKHGDEYPLTDLKPRGSGDSTIDMKTSNTKTEPKKTTFWSPVVGLFVNSLENEMPDKHEVLRLTKAETERRQRLVEQTNPSWTKYLKESDRDTMHEHASPALNWIPYVGTKVDSIDYRTVLLAIYNKKIEELQKDPERFPLMNSAFIQFNHQIAAHMACQSLNHHVPLQMTPRTVEISPDDVRWDQLSIPWYMRYARTVLVLVIVVAGTILWAFPVAFTGSLSQIDEVAQTYPWLGFVTRWPESVRSVVQGVLPPALIGLLLVLLPLILRWVTSLQGITTGTQLELSVQIYYFVFLFIQVFLVVTLASGISTILEIFTDGNVTSIPDTLARSLPKASNYFFSFIILQALSVSAGAILQLANLFFLYVWAKMVDTSPRSLFKRATSLPTINWGTFFPVYTNFAVIGIVYAIIAPLIMVFVIVTFALFWIVHRYNALYVNRYTNDTGGLLFPRAVTQLFTGLYTMHICLFGLFILETRPDKSRACFPQAIIIAVVFFFLILYQITLNRNFSPLYRYIPITMEDDAVERDEEFAALQERQYEEGRLADEKKERKERENLQDILRKREREEEEESRALEEAERQRIEDRRQGRDSSPMPSQHLSPSGKGRKSSWASRRSSAVQDRSLSDPANEELAASSDGAVASKVHRVVRPRHRHHHTSTSTPHPGSDIEAQKPIEERFYAGISDELEDLTKDERDILVNKAFRHRALRATRPAVWIPKDRAGVSEFEIMVIDSSEELRQYIWISDEGASLTKTGSIDDEKMMRPPDFNEEKLIKL